MPLVAATMSNELFSTLSAAGFSGAQLINMCTALGTGLVSATVGKSFSTADTGSTAGAGTGSGVGLTAASSIGKAAMIAESAAKGISGSKAIDLYDAIATAYSNQLALATLSSTHAPVYAGSGILTAGSIPITKSSASPIIFAEGVSLGMLGTSWQDFSDIVAAGVEAMILVATGQVVILGAGSIPPVPAIGTGSGLIS